MRFLTTALLFHFAFYGAAFSYDGAKFEPADGKIYHGSGWNYRDSQRLYESMFPGDKIPLVLQVNTSIPGTRGTSADRIAQSLTLPIIHADSQFVEYSMHWQGRDASIMLDSVYYFTDQWDQYVDMLDSAFGQVERPFFFRIGFEFNGAWNPYHPWIYPLAFRKLVTELRRRGHNHFATVWCYEPDADGSFADSTRQGWKWYPGDDVVDWFGLDLFQVEHFDPSLPDSNRSGLSKKGRSEVFLRFAEARGKPVYLNEFSAIHINVTPDSLDQNGEDGSADWAAFFTPFFEFLDNHPNIKGWNYIDVDWSSINSYRDQGWMDARLEINQTLRDRWVEQLSSDRFLQAGYDISQELSVENLPIQSTPTEYSIQRIYPNPFNSITHIDYRISSAAQVNVAIYDTRGCLVEELSSGKQSPGAYSLEWNADYQSTGIYFLKLTVNESTGMRRLLLLR